jgi:hypothetical protein
VSDEVEAVVAEEGGAAACCLLVAPVPPAEAPKELPLSLRPGVGALADAADDTEADDDTCDDPRARRSREVEGAPPPADCDCSLPSTPPLPCRWACRIAACSIHTRVPVDWRAAAAAPGPAVGVEGRRPPRGDAMRIFAEEEDAVVAITAMTIRRRSGVASSSCGLMYKCRAAEGVAKAVGVRVAFQKRWGGEGIGRGEGDLLLFPSLTSPGIFRPARPSRLSQCSFFVDRADGGRERERPRPRDVDARAPGDALGAFES